LKGKKSFIEMRDVIMGLLERLDFVEAFVLEGREFLLLGKFMAKNRGVHFKVFHLRCVWNDGGKVSGCYGFLISLAKSASLRCKK
jgi:hypothetical protein